HAQPEDTNKLLQKLLEDLQIISEELAEYINSLSWNRPTFYNNDEEHSIQYKEYLENSSNAFTTVLPIIEPEYSLNPHYFNAESNLIESLSNQDILFDSSPKFDYLEEFSGELMPTSIINEGRIKRDHEEYISLIEKLLTINSFPRPLENFHANTIIETLPTSPIPIEDSDSLREEIDIFTGKDDFMPLGIKSDDYESEGDIYFLEELLSNDSISLPKNKSSNFDHHNDPSFPRPLSKPPDVEIFFEPDSGVLTTNVVKGISEHYVLMPNILPTLPTFDPLYPLYDTLLLFSSENKDKVFKPGILSCLLVSHWDKTTSDFFENPMMMIAPQCLKTLVFGVLSRFTRASHPLLAISLGKSDILDHYRICFLYA
nr:hypothetical protein [Tanacetum cinerariifolium]